MKNIALILTIFTIALGCAPKKDGVAKMHADNQEPTMQHCVGRSVIELPVSFVASSVTTGIFKAQSLGAQDEPMDVLVRAGIDPGRFAIEVQKRKAELEASSSLNVDVLREVKALGDDATLFRVQRIDDAYVSEIVFLRGGNIVTVRLHSFREKYLAAEGNLIRFAGSIKALGSEKNSISNKGFCLGLIEIDGDFKIEKGNFLFRNGRGAQFEINVDTYAPDERISLLDRMSGSGSLLKVFDVRHTVHRTGERTVAGMRAQEWLGAAQTAEDEDAKAFHFTLETMRSSPSKTTPAINLTFETAQPLEDGAQTRTLISEEEAIRLWDSVVASLRSTQS